MTFNTKKLNAIFSEKNIMYFIGFAAFCFYLLLAYSVPFDFFNHDLGGLNVKRGHMGYFWHIWENCSLPVFSIDPVTTESYYNPPLHYILGALWIRISLFFTDSVAKGFEWLQVLTSIYMGIALIFVYKILFLLKIKHKILCWSFICFHPMMFIMSSIINNDGLAFLMMTIVFYYGLKWFYNPTFKTMIKASIFIGLALMSKFGTVVILGVLACIFASRFLKDKEKRKSYIYQIIASALIVLPLGGWYYGYAYFKWNTPINYVQGLKDPKANLGAKYTLIERFTHNEYSDFYINLKKDRNMLALGIKTSLFDEQNYSNNKILNTIAGGMFYMSVFFFAIICFNMLSYFLYCPFSKFKTPNFVLNFTIFLLLSSFVFFNFLFPHPFTANFRYIPLFFICAICLWDKTIRDKRLLFYLPSGICFFSFVFYIVFFMDKLL